MNTQMIAPENGRLARPLNVLAPLIREQYKAMQTASEEAEKPYYHVLGELLLEAKTQLPYGEFQEWIKRNCDFSYPSAVVYMRYVKTLPAFQKDRTYTSSNSSPTLDSVAHPNLANQPREIRRTIVEASVRSTPIDRLSQQQQSKEKELRLMRQLADQLIDIGYKVLATKLHPDKGGSREAMARLNEVRRRLKAAI